MDAVVREPAQVFSVAEYIAEELEARGWTTRDLAARMSDKVAPGIRVLALDLMLACANEPGLLIEDDDLRDFAHAFEVDTDLFCKLHAIWLAWPDRRSLFDCPEHILSK